MRHVVIVGLLLLAAFLPLVALPLAIVTVAAPVFLAFAAHVVRAGAESGAQLALADPRGPPRVR